MNWENKHRLPFLCTTETKLRVFQFMFLHRRRATNDVLFKIGLKNKQSPVLSAGNLLKPLPTCSGIEGTFKNSGRHLSMDNSKHYLKQTHCFSPITCLGLIDISKIELVDYYQCYVLIG